MKESSNPSIQRERAYCYVSHIEARNLVEVRSASYILQSTCRTTKGFIAI